MDAGLEGADLIAKTVEPVVALFEAGVIETELDGQAAHVNITAGGDGGGLWGGPLFLLARACILLRWPNTGIRHGVMGSHH